MTDSTRDATLNAIGLLEEPVRRQLYEYVAARPHSVGRDEAAKAVGVSRGLAAFHLDRLTRAGLLEAGYQRLTGRVGPGAGRPARVYRRADRDISVSLPDRRYERAAHLFADSLERLGDGALPPQLVDSARELGEQLAARATPPPRANARRRLMTALADGGYEPLVDERGVIRMRNCPFDALAQQHRSLVCGTNLAISEGLVNGARAAAFEPVLDPEPGYCCVRFRPRAAAPPDGNHGATRPDATERGFDASDLAP